MEDSETRVLHFFSLLDVMLRLAYVGLLVTFPLER
jgi:hypothetical protein